jgi:CheY-like chemotaxis protein
MSTEKDNDRKVLVTLGVAGLLALVFVIDFFTRHGLAEWVLYILPVGLCLFQRSALVPIFVAAAASVLLVVGFLTSPLGMDPELAAINRTIGFVTIWVVAFTARATLLTRAGVLRLSWLTGGRGEISKSALGDLKPEETGNALLAALAGYVGAHVGVLYRLEGDALLRVAGYALQPSAQPPAAFKLGQGVVGQVARSMKPVQMHELPGDYLRVVTGSGSALPQSVIVSPITVDGAPYGVIELGFMRRLDDAEDVLELLSQTAGDVGIVVRTAIYRQRVLELLEETQRQGEELQAQQEELRVNNEELQEQSKALKESQARLENQQSELEETNAQLEAQTNDLERQRHDLLQAQTAIRASARRLERASRYKSEFLANMSHELRTPLNSSLILAKVLADNKTGNLTDDQVNYANVILRANNDLLSLINDILDLSKIEAGHVEIQPETIQLGDVVERIRATFEPLAGQKKLAFRVEASAHAPAALTTDARRLEQILRNLLSNAIKFTDAGSVELKVNPHAGDRVSFAVEDTGIGIPEEERATIFDPFHQADGTASRKYSGTGLGLSISRELARLLGGAIEVQSTVGVGSVFTLTIPTELDADAPPMAEAAPGEPSRPAPQSLVTRAAERPAAPAPAPLEHIDDDRHERARERLILVVEDDPEFARILYGVAHDLDLDCVHTASGTEAYALARELKPSGIVLDVKLPDDSGLSVLERLKRDPATRHIPVHMMSVDDHTQPALELGAIGYTLKPAAREQLQGAIAAMKGRLDERVRRLLVVEDDETLRNSIAVLLTAEDVDIEMAGTAAEALERLASGAFDCIIMDLALPDASGFELLERVSESGKYSSPPVIVYTGRALTPEDEQRLRRYSRSIIIKGARSPERLLDEVTLFLHRVESTLPPDQQKLLRQARQRDAAFEGRSILLAEDDVRNIYALSSVLEPLGAKLVIARNGREALQCVSDGNRVDLVLMDVMMPEMDGLTAIAEIRKSSDHARLPIIAITARAMPEDRQACLDAGANDYVSKPIDVDRLLSLCRVWMPK